MLNIYFFAEEDLYKITKSDFVNIFFIKKIDKLDNFKKMKKVVLVNQKIQNSTSFLFRRKCLHHFDGWEGVLNCRTRSR